jgi:hypothetical protein
MFCSKHVTVQNLQMNRCLDDFTTEQVRCLLKAYDSSKPPDEQMFRCFHHRGSKMFCSKHLTLQNLQMNRCLDVSTKIKVVR